MSEVLRDLSDPALATAVAGNLRALFASIGRPGATGIGVAGSDATGAGDTPFGFRWLTPVAHPWFRGVWSDAAPPSDADAGVAATVRAFRRDGAAAFTWWLSPDVDRTPWGRLLARHGFRHEPGPPGMAMDLDELPPLATGELEIRHVADAVDLEAWSSTFARGYGLPGEMAAPFAAMLAEAGIALPYRHYLGRLGGEAVAASTLFLGAGAAGIYNVGTIPEARGRGVGTAMTVAPLLEARELGYRAGVLQTSDLGASVYRRIGFRTLGRVDHFSWREPSEAGVA